MILRGLDSAEAHDNHPVAVAVAEAAFAGVGGGGTDALAAPASGIRTGTTELGLDSVP